MKSNIKKQCCTLLIVSLWIFCQVAQSKPITQLNTIDSLKNQKPNIVFIVADDLGWADLECYGNKSHQTKNLNKMAMNGIRFTNAYASAPVCSPTRASILTGKSPALLDLTDWIPGRQVRLGLEKSKKLQTPEFEHQLNLNEATIAESLKKLGYKTASIGKWHLGDSVYLPTAHGFDVNIGGLEKGYPPSYFYPYQAKDADGKVTYELKDVKDLAKKDEYLTDALTTQAIQFIQKNKENPFFLYLPYYAVHAPIEAKPDLVKKYAYLADKNSKAKNFNPEYAALVETMDTNVGRVLDAIEALHLTENTLIVFVSDNGGLTVKDGKGTPATTNYPLRAGKGHLYEGGVRIPLIIQWKGHINKEFNQTNVVSTNDLYPTVLDILKQNSAPDLDGKSVYPLLLGKPMNEERPMFWHYPHYSNQGNSPASAIRKGRYKLIEFYEENRLELYDLESDISESKNLVSTLPETARILKTELDQWKKSVKAKEPVPNPIYEAPKP